MVINTGLGKKNCNVRNIPMVLFILTITAFKFFSKFNQAPRTILRCFGIGLICHCG